MTHEDRTIPSTAQAADRPVDGVVCFGGEDWWYHNRGHYDMQMMREFTASVPVLYVNSIGMRTPRPREGRMFVTRMRRKLRSIRRGLVRVDDRFWVLSPFAVPGRVGGAVSNPLLVGAVRRAMRRLGITRPLLWVACPAAAGVRHAFAASAVVYQRTDRYECFPGIDVNHIRACDRDLKQHADATVFCARSLYDDERGSCRRALLVDHGVDLSRFARHAPEPEDVASLPRPRIGFVGGIDAHTFDPQLFDGVAARMPHATFVLVGASSLPTNWCTRPNVVQLGQRPFDAVPAYLAACDALIMPWRRSTWIDACHPVKLKEYLASGRPVVSTPFAQLADYEGLVHVASDAGSFADALGAALQDDGDAAERRACLIDETWSRKANAVARCVLDTPLAALGSVPVAPPRPSGPTPVAAQRRGRSGAESAPPIAACIMLAGGVTVSPLVAALGRSILDQWIGADHTVLAVWLARLRELEAELGRPFPTRIIHDAAAPVPWPPTEVSPHLRVEREPRGLRGPAGVLRDVCRRYAADEQILAVEAGRLLDTPILPLVRTHEDRGADVTVAANRDGAPSGLYVIRCSALDLVPADGFMDIKEQWLPRVLAADGRVGVHHLDDLGGLPLRTRREMLDAARLFACDHGPADTPTRIVCRGAKIGPGAVVVDALVMPGAVIGAGAVVTRSIVGPNTVIPPNARVTDTIVTAGRLSTTRTGGAHAA